MSSKVLVTGATGFLGRQICKAFEQAGWDVVGTGFSRARPPTLLRLDLADHEAVAKRVEQEKWVRLEVLPQRPSTADHRPTGRR